MSNLGTIIRFASLVGDTDETTAAPEIAQVAGSCTNCLTWWPVLRGYIAYNNDTINRLISYSDVAKACKIGDNMLKYPFCFWLYDQVTNEDNISAMKSKSIITDVSNGEDRNAYLEKVDSLITSISDTLDQGASDACTRNPNNPLCACYTMYNAAGQQKTIALGDLVEGGASINTSWPLRHTPACTTTTWSTSELNDYNKMSSDASKSRTYVPKVIREDTSEYPENITICQNLMDVSGSLNNAGTILFENVCGENSSGNNSGSNSSSSSNNGNNSNNSSNSGNNGINDSINDIISGIRNSSNDSNKIYIILAIVVIVVIVIVLILMLSSSKKSKPSTSILTPELIQAIRGM